MKKISCFFAVSLVFFMFLSPGAGELKKSGLRILYSASLNGNLDGCTCKSNPRAGLIKRAYYLRNLENRQDTVLLDAGDILDAMQDPLLAEHIFAVYDELGYHGIAVGEQELSNGFEKLLEYKSDFPLLSHNLYICPTEDSCVIFSLQPVVIRKNNMTLGLFSIFDPRLHLFIKQELKNKVKVKDPFVIAENMVTLLKEDDVDLIVLLYHGYYENAKKLVNKIKGINLIILGHEQQLIDLKKINSTFIVSPGKEGNSLGILEITPKKSGGFIFNNTFKDFNYSADPDDEFVRKRIDQYYDKMKVK